jgi:hypothetical protein
MNMIKKMKKIKRLQDIKQEKMRLRIKQLELEKQLKTSWKEVKTGGRHPREPENKSAETGEEKAKQTWLSVVLGYGAAYISQKLATKAGEATEARVKESMENMADKVKDMFTRKKK